MSVKTNHQRVRWQETRSGEYVEIIAEWSPKGWVVAERSMFDARWYEIDPSSKLLKKIQFLSKRDQNEPRSSTGPTMSKTDDARVHRSHQGAESFVAKVTFHSCFISYSSKDEGFAKRLHADLENNGVRCWFAPKDLKIGDKLRQSFDEAIRQHDKLMVVLSESSVKSPWVEKEVETAFETEHQQNKVILFPIRLDDAVMDAKQAWAADIRRSRHIGDFRRWMNNDSYRNALDRLLRDLRTENESRVGRATLNRFRRVSDTALWKPGFRPARLPRGWKNWNDYFCNELEDAGLTPIRYNKYRVAAHQICDLHTNTILFETKPADQSSPFVNRFAAEGKPAAHKYQFTPREIEDFGIRIGKKLKNDPAVWATGLRFDSSGHCVTICWEEIDYFRAYVLCNQIYYQQHKFELGPEAQWTFPFFLLRDNFREFSRHNYCIWALNPPIFGLDVVLETSDEMCVLQRRSSETATHGGRIVPLGAGYEPADFRGGSDPLTTGVIREMKSELGLSKSEFKLEPIGIFHVVPSNELNFAVHATLRFTFDELRQRVEERVPPEKWEYKNLIHFKMEDVLACSTPWKITFEEMSATKRDRAVMASYYCDVAKALLRAKSTGEGI